MSLRAETEPGSRTLRPISLWLAPWLLYSAAIVATVGARAFNRHDSAALRFFLNNEVLQLWAALVVVLWLGTRIALGVRARRVWLVGAISLGELVCGFVVYQIWVFAMIGRINPG